MIKYMLNKISWKNQSCKFIWVIQPLYILLRLFTKVAITGFFLFLSFTCIKMSLSYLHSISTSDFYSDYHLFKRGGQEILLLVPY